MVDRVGQGGIHADDSISPIHLIPIGFTRSTTLSDIRTTLPGVAGSGTAVATVSPLNIPSALSSRVLNHSPISSGAVAGPSSDSSMDHRRCPWKGFREDYPKSYAACVGEASDPAVLGT